MYKHFSLSKRFFAILLAMCFGTGMSSSFAASECNGPRGTVGALSGVFSTSDSTMVHFSQGNLQYRASTNTWRFATSQYDIIGLDNNKVSETYDGWIDLFGWGTSGYNHGAVCYQPWSVSVTEANYNAYGNTDYNLFDETGKADWGYNAISNGGNQENKWHTLTINEWNYMFFQRETPSGVRFAKATVNGVKGVVLLPDNWEAETFEFTGANSSSTEYRDNEISDVDWETILEPAGAVFLPAAGGRNSKNVSAFSTLGNEYPRGFYWSSNVASDYGAMRLQFTRTALNCNTELTSYRYQGYSVRLVCPASVCTVSVSAEPEEGGTVAINGEAVASQVVTVGQPCILTATPNPGYVFMYWTLEDGTILTTNTAYTFTAQAGRHYVAHFTEGDGQYLTLSTGYNWVSTFIDMEGAEGLQTLQNALGENGMIIKSQSNGYNSYLAGYGWYGSLQGLTNGLMYQIKTNADVEIMLSGDLAEPTTPITLNPGQTWIGYLPSVPMTIQEAFANIQPRTGDMVKSQSNGYASYLEGFGWYGSLTMLYPGMGLMYKSNNTEPVQLVYPDPAGE
ncbi:MAG: hypothetical protein IJP44_05555 [Bacteroidales bacterium]|nr:hypothetical protein [Bacteroidales bacterium]